MTYESERQTRKRRIDPKLRDRGWTVVPYDAAKPISWFPDSAIEEYPTDNGPADYAFCVDGRILAVAEAKKITLGPQNVLTQAQRYSRGLSSSPMNFDGNRVPFLYSTNGEVLWFQDARHRINRSRTITQFHTPDALRELADRDFASACSGSLGTQSPTRSYGHTRSRPTSPSNAPSPTANARCSSPWPPEPARPSRW